MSFTKKIHEELWTHETIVERMVGLTFSSSNIHEVVNNNNKPYMNMVMYAMMMNQLC
jgi:hypothetical protein